MRKLFISIICLFVMPLITDHSNIYGQNIESISKQAIQAYNQKKYDTTIALYEKIISEGYESSVLYYNLGNAYFRTNELAPAILYYEKAKKIDPNNEDILFNIQIVNQKLIDKVDQIPDFFINRWWKNMLNITSLKNFAIANILLLAISMLFIVIYFISNNINISKVGFFGSLIFLILFGTSLIIAIQKDKILNTHQEGIIFTPTVNIKSSPDSNSKDIFVLHEGTKVSLLDQLNDWQEIRIANGNKGWIKKSDYREI